jgi:hypothetical protein
MSKASELARLLSTYAADTGDMDDAAALLLEQEKALLEAERLLISGHVDAAISKIRKVLNND